MKRISYRYYILLVGFILFAITSLVIIINGRYITVKYDIEDASTEISDYKLNIEQDKNIIAIVDKKIKGNYLEIKIKSINKGKAFVSIDSVNNYNFLTLFYVHSFGIITKNTFFGYSSGSIVIPICVSIFITFIILLVIKKYIKSNRCNMYQYCNIQYLGLTIFLIFALMAQLYSLKNYTGLDETIRFISYASRMFDIYMLPLGLCMAIFVSISNIILMKKEGFNIKNALGIILGIFILLGTLLPLYINDLLQNATFIDVHNERGFWCYFQMFFETTVYGIITYLECILIGTIICSIKAAMHNSKYDKDYIIILGCGIKKDGSLTNLLKSRVDKAVKFSKMQESKTGKRLKFIPSGGQGSDEVISEAHAISNYLISTGINSKDIIIEDKSRNTKENIINSMNLIKNNKKVIYSTTNYHVFRAGNIAYKLGYNIEGIGSNTKQYFWINAFIREFIATLNNERKKHIFFILVLIVSNILLAYFLYLTNII